MLFAQIPTKLRRRVASELKIDLKIVAATLTPTTPQDSRYSKLELVETFLRKHAAVGSVDEPDAYFGGRLEMTWGPMFDGQLGWEEAAAVVRASTGQGGLRRTLEFLARRVALRHPENPPEWARHLADS